MYTYIFCTFFAYYLLGMFNKYIDNQINKFIRNDNKWYTTYKINTNNISDHINLKKEQCKKPCFQDAEKKKESKIQQSLSMITDDVSKIHIYDSKNRNRLKQKHTCGIKCSTHNPKGIECLSDKPKHSHGIECLSDKPKHSHGIECLSDKPKHSRHSIEHPESDEYVLICKLVISFKQKKLNLIQRNI